MALEALPQSGILAPSTVKIWLEHRTRIFDAPLTGYQQRQRLFAKWRAVFTWDALEQPDALQLIAFADRVFGGNDAFTIYDPTRTAIRGDGTGTPVVATNNEAGKQLATSGWTGVTTVLKAGDVFTLAATGEHFEVTADAPFVGGGNVTLDISPYIRATPSAGEALLMGTPATIKMRLDQPVATVTTPPLIYQIEMQMTEDMFA